MTAKGEQRNAFDEVVEGIDLALGLAKGHYETTTDPEQRAAILARVREVRGILLFGNVGVSGKLYALYGAIEMAADEIREGFDAKKTAKNEADALAAVKVALEGPFKSHGLRISAHGPQLHRALLGNAVALDHLAKATVALITRNTKGWTKELHTAARLVGLVSLRGAAATKRQSPESRETRAIRKNLKEATDLAGEHSPAARPPARTPVARAPARPKRRR